MSHKIIIIQPPGGGNRMAEPAEFTITVEYSPSHDLTPEQEHRNIHKIENQTAKFYAKLQERLVEPGE